MRPHCRTLEEMRALKTARANDDLACCAVPGATTTTTTTTVHDPYRSTTTVTTTTVDHHRASLPPTRGCVFFPHVCNHNRHVRDWCVHCTRRMLFPDASVCVLPPPPCS